MLHLTEPFFADAFLSSLSVCHHLRTTFLCKLVYPRSASLKLFLSHSFVTEFTIMSDFSDLDRQIDQLRRCEIIKESEVKALCAKAREILVEESNVQRVDSPVTVSFASFCTFIILN